MATIYKSKELAINALIKTEKAEDGYLEKASNKNLYSKTANAGDANYTKYWKDLADLGLMGQDKDFAGGPAWYWCAGFQTWCFIQTFGKTNAKKLLLHIPYTSCANLGTLAKKKNQLFDTPEVGDIVLFYNGTRFYHTGYVVEKTKTTITVVEGNTNNSKEVIPNGGAVCIKTYTIASCKKKGHKFFRPDYSIVVSKPKTATTTKKDTTPKKKYAIINTNGSSLRCRKSPSSTGALIGAFSKGSTVTLLEKTNSKWWKVSGKAIIKGKEETITGYSAAQYLLEK